MKTCAGCKQNIPHREYLTCSICNDPYDLECANVTDKRFYNTMGPEHRLKWKCQACWCKMPKQDNSNKLITPVDENHEPTLNLSSEMSHQNVTLRPKPMTSSCQTICLDLTNGSETGDEVSELGDTINVNSLKDTEQMSYDHLCKFILEKLDNNRQSIINEIKSVVQQEVAIAISELKLDCIKRTDLLTCEQKNLHIKISELDRKIVNLEKQLQDIQNKQFPISKTETKNSNNSDNSKKIVLHGLEEYRGETESDICNRVSQIFYDFLNIDADGYIEEIHRIGKRGNQRPLEIELLSKKMAKLILENSRYLKNSPFSVTEYLDREDIEKRRELKKVLIEARANGKYAILRGNKLFINGEEYCTNKTLTTTNMQTHDTEHAKATVNKQEQINTQNKYHRPSRTKQNHNFRNK